jgi:hypothetical protein
MAIVQGVRSSHSYFHLAFRYLSKVTPGPYHQMS